MNSAPMQAEPGHPDPAADPDDTGWPGPDVFDEDALSDDGEPAAAPRGTSARPAVSVADAQLARWIGSVVDHDERALAALYDASFARVFGLVQRIVRRTALAEEVVEDTYFQVWRQAVRFDPARGSAITWLLAMARSRAIDALRREARFQHETLDEEQIGAAGGEAAAADELLDVARHHAALHQALMALGAQPRQLVALAFFRGLSHEEIAAQTCLPLGTVKSQIRRALITMRQALGSGGCAALAS